MSSVVSLNEYLSRARHANTHTAKQVILANLLKEVFGVQLEDLIPGIEKKVGSRILGVRGRIDLLYSNVVFEVKVDLERELEDAKAGLKKYFQALLEINPNAKLVGIATDLINFKAFIPVVENGIVKDVKEISSIDIEKASPTEAILWLDSYIFSKPRIRPTATDLRFRFGPGSPTYAIAVETLKTLWSSVKDVEDVKLRFDLWQKNMEIVYGSAPSENAFIEQTYLVTLVKLVTYYWLSGDDKVSRDRLLSVLRGEYFVKYGINNLIEEDFFSWILHRKVVDEALELFAGVAKELLKYDLTQIDEDFFKEIYENIVERGQRHRIGEYYTPEWLAELTLREVLELWWSKSGEPPRIIDPACGSGTFLVNAIRIMKERLKSRGWRPEDILSYMLTSIVGVDINPLAVTITRANYLFALGELLSYRKGSITIPIYVADSIKLPEVKRTLYGGGEPVYEYEVGGYHLQVPANVAKDRTRFGKVLAVFREAIDAYRNGRKKDEVLKLFERALQEVVTQAELAILKSTLNSILTLIDSGRDSIWVYMLSNIYIPIALSESKFDIVVGNPPWVIMRYIENAEYQDFVKNYVLSYGLLRRDQTHLFTAIEIATAFFCRVSDLYLKDNGIIGFVMPRSILTGALQHAEFRKFRKPPMNLHKILDLEGVTPLFNIPACVLIASKGGKTEYPVPARAFSGKLPEKNLKLLQATRYLKVEEYSYQPPQVQQGVSPYDKLFKAGATIYPRTFFFIDFIVHPTLGIDVEKPYCKTTGDPEVLMYAKEPWRHITLEGNVEREFIYATVLSGNLLPFRYEPKPVVLPIKPTASGYRILDVEDLRREGYNYMALWLEKTQKLWEKLRTKKSAKLFPKVVKRLDHQKALSSQNPNKRYVVLYDRSGKDLTSCVVDKQVLPLFKVNNFTIKPVNFVADGTTMFYETDNELEAHYLCAALNSDVINELIKPLQSKGSKGERDIVRRPFMFSIPRFDPDDPVHRRLAELSKACHEKASRITLTKRGVVARRKEVRDALKAEMAEINKLVSQLLGLS